MLLLVDLDGVVYAGAGALPYAVESLNLSREGRRLGYITNNASRTDASVAGHLSELGLATAPADVVTSPQAAMRLLAERIAEHTGQTPEQVNIDSDRDRWFTAAEAKEYGIIDDVIQRRVQITEDLDES